MITDVNNPERLANPGERKVIGGVNHVAYEVGVAWNDTDEPSSSQRVQALQWMLDTYSRDPERWAYRPHIRIARTESVHASDFGQGPLEVDPMGWAVYGIVWWPQVVSEPPHSVREGCRLNTPEIIDATNWPDLRTAR